MGKSSLRSDVKRLKWLCSGILLCLLAGLAIDIYWVHDNERTNRFRNDWNEVAKDYSHRRNWSALLEHADAWLLEQPEEPYALHYRALALYQMKDYAPAADAFRKVRSIAPSWAEQIDRYLEMCDQQLGSKSKQAEQPAAADPAGSGAAKP
jgi:tetratricopeptide (TPR) repeat protein